MRLTPPSIAVSLARRPARFVLSKLLHLLLITLFMVIAQAARADVAVMVPPHVDQLPSSDVLDQAVEELTRLLKLQGFDVVSGGQAGPAAEAEQQRGAFAQAYDPLYCVTPECANEYRKLFDATFAVQLIISSREQKPASVSVVLTENPRAFFAGAAPVEGRDVRSAVRSAFEAARQKQEEGAGPWLTVTGKPRGAQVYLDGAEYGQLPFSKRHVEAGVHKLEVRDDRYLVEQRTLNIPGNIDHVEVANVVLKPLAGGEAGRRSSHRGVVRSPWDWALGGTLAAAGAVHLISGIYQKSKAGDCSHHEGGLCTERYSDANRTRENLLIGLGASGIALGAVVVGLGPIGHLQLQTGAGHAVLKLKGTF
ncbi:MAG: hypothetical protein JWN48_4994 [Myxococcaceae bacterium]|nr:hypothetical protein [Myxococcaceae bacterium]